MKSEDNLRQLLIVWRNLMQRIYTLYFVIIPFSKIWSYTACLDHAAISLTLQDFITVIRVCAAVDYVESPYSMFYHSNANLALQTNFFLSRFVPCAWLSRSLKQASGESDQFPANWTRQMIYFLPFPPHYVCS